MRGAVFLLAALQGSCAYAQTSGSISLVSDYRFRGESLSDGQAEPQIAISYDHPSGAYAGAFASKVDIGENRDTQANVYAGYAGHLNPHSSWDIGMTSSTFVRTPDLDYQEIYAGISFDDLEGRIYFSPHYFGRDVRTAYMEVNGSYPLLAHLHLIAHLGALYPQGGQGGFDSGTQHDYRVGLNMALSNWNLQLERVTADSRPYQYPGYRSPSVSAWVAGASYSF